MGEKIDYYACLLHERCGDAWHVIAAGSPQVERIIDNLRKVLEDKSRSPASSITQREQYIGYYAINVTMLT